MCVTYCGNFGVFPSVDLFATHLRFRLPSFISQFPDPSAVAMNTFLYDWDNQDLLPFHTFAMVRQVLVYCYLGTLTSFSLPSFGHRTNGFRTS